MASQQGDVSTARACYDRAIASSSPRKSLPILMEYAKMEGMYGGTWNHSRRDVNRDTAIYSSL